ncbi:gamma-glutamylcyclotransferase family protein [Bradyrhizobium sp. Ai1a-2]|uniref:gamma-glutamylcyclotransferase family protein n=1 Tax=Bradyrhizobium sp. Ai1a-2 TaxID=196490 RepID=UPI0003FBC509|nr:gamma-glutamylcyclotransferase family protein [Bradyrhizobium sp. Ai1a-2]
MAERVTVFFYGLFMDPEGLQAKVLQPANVRQAYVERFALRLGDRATLLADPDGRVYGTTASLTHAELDRLYSGPSVAAYRPEPVLAQFADGTAELALCFNLPIIPQEKTANPTYAADLRAVARKMGLPAWPASERKSKRYGTAPRCGQCQPMAIASWIHRTEAQTRTQSHERQQSPTRRSPAYDL